MNDFFMFDIETCGEYPDYNTKGIEEVRSGDWMLR